MADTDLNIGEHDNNKVQLEDLSTSEDEYADLWDREYVKMPFSSYNTYRKKNNPTKELSKWYLIDAVLQSPFQDSNDLEEAIKSYNARNHLDFSGLHDFFDTEYTEAEAKEFFDIIIPKMVDLALALPNLIVKPIPLLVKHVDNHIMFSQIQIASLLANAFFCTIPRQGGGSNDVNCYPTINFGTLYEAPCTPKKTAKLQALIHYFKRVIEKRPAGMVSFHRQVLADFPDWETDDRPLRCLTVEKEGTIEDKGTGLLQVDFANKLIGGGVLGSGSVQEEIRFVLNPELIVARLFTSELEDNEVVIIKGAERFSIYRGYSDTFEWAGDYIDTSLFDEYNRRETTLVAMDAVHLYKQYVQYQPPFLERELNKAYCGFFDVCSNVNLAPVATGNWGCGVFGGDRSLKSILQLMAATGARRNVVYFTFMDDTFADKLTYITKLVVAKKVTIGNMYGALLEYYTLLQESKSTLALFDYLEACFM